MHAMAFFGKRAHLGATRVGHRMFRHVPDMTPARFEMLYVFVARIRMWPRWNEGYRYCLDQIEITERLGLSRQTIWEGVNRLVELGLLTKEKSNRRNVLYLTEVGFRRLRAAMNAAFSERAPLPSDAPAVEPVPRHWRRPELADPRPANAPQTRLGREVERVYTAFAWKFCGRRGRRGRRGKRNAYLQKLDRVIGEWRFLADAFGYGVPALFETTTMKTNDH